MDTLAVIVIWTVSIWVTDPCPLYKPDPYTGEYPLVHCLVIHGHYETKEMRQMFAGREAAEEFIKNAPDEIRPTMKILDSNEHDSLAQTQNRPRQLHPPADGGWGVGGCAM